MNLLVLDLINISKGISTIDENKMDINLGDLLNQICDDMQIKANKYRININRDIYEGFIYGRINKIRELIINIIDNAIKYSRNYIIEVINSGQIIPEEVYNSIFDPFIRNNNYEDEDSRGLGLYLCSEIVKDHDGEITITNGERIIVNIKLPCFRNNLETTL